MRGAQARPDAASRGRRRPGSVLTAGSAGLLILIGAVIAAARAGVSQDVTLPHWWGNWPHRQPGQLRGWVAAGIVLLGAQCALWVWLAARLLRPWTATTEQAAPGDSPAEHGRRRPGLGVLAGIAGLWTLPLLVTGPMGSLDVHSYAAIGRLAALGLDPYLATPGWLTDRFAGAVDPMWRSTPTPYGPLQVALLRGLLLVAGDHVGAAVLLIRSVAVLGAVCAVALAVRAASSAERVPVLLVTGFNPVVLVHVVSGAHLDVLIGALAVVVVGLARSGRPAVAMSLAVVAMSIKLPGVVLVAFVLVDLVRAGPSVCRPGRILRLLASGLGTLSLVVVLCPDPFGWTAALGVPGMSRSGTAPSTWISYLVAAVTGQASGDGLAFAFTVGRAMMALVGAAAVCVLLWKATSGSRAAAFQGVGWALVVFALTAPALYPWYLVWGLFCAAVGSGVRGRAVLMALSCSLCLAAAAGEGTGVLVTWGGVLLAVLGWTVWVARDLLADRPGDSAGRPTAPPAATRAGSGLHPS